MLLMLNFMLNRIMMENVSPQARYGENTIRLRITSLRYPAVIGVRTSGTPSVVLRGGPPYGQKHLDVHFSSGGSVIVMAAIVWPLLTSIYQEMIEGRRLVSSTKCQRNWGRFGLKVKSAFASVNKLLDGWTFDWSKQADPVADSW